MQTIDNIPISKIRRAGKIIQTGAKVGVNYLKYYGDKLSVAEQDAKQRLDESNAEDIYDGLSNLKGSALKVAQMLSMEKSIMPDAYVDKFSLSQFSVPPLSAPLVIKTFKKYFGKAPEDIFDEFNPNSINAASIGQVHQATLNGKKLAVKIQYPGVSDSISSDLALVKPIAIRMFNINGQGSDKYFKEVEDKLLDETNYLMEVDQSLEITEACKHIVNLKFPQYYPDLSSERIITMDWMEGKHLSEFAESNTDTALANSIGQALWDFYMHQIHTLGKVHADPHPGNFLVSKEGKLLPLDFGCIKEIPSDFYNPYFEMIKKEVLNDRELFITKLYELEIIKVEDSVEEREFFITMFHKILSHFSKPFQFKAFDFSNKDFFEEFASLGTDYAKNSELRKMNGNRGSKHFIYINRTFFGLYNLLHTLQANKIAIHR